MLYYDSRYLFTKGVYIAALILIFCGGPLALAEVRLPSIIGSHMVLQQKSEVELWGWCEPPAAGKIARHAEE